MSTTDMHFPARAGTSSGGTGEGAAPSRVVTDVGTRVLHGLMAISLVGAYLTAESEWWRLWHLALGYLFVGSVAMRVVFGVLGPRHAHVRQWSLRASAVWRWAAQGLQPQAWSWSHWSKATLMAVYASIVLALLAVLPLGLSGVVIHLEWGPWFWVDAMGELHEAVGELSLALVLGHIAAVLVHGWMQRTPHWQRMFSGRVPQRGPDVRGGLWWAVLTVALSVGFLFQVFSGRWPL